MRFYGFTADEITSEADQPELSLTEDPKTHLGPQPTPSSSPST